jgi:dTDP-4-amino-4,6-dideoxygalactose transaminase
MFLVDHEVGAFAMYPILVPLQGAYEDMGYSEADFPVGAPNAHRVLNMPMFETLREDEAREAAQAVLAYYDRA